MDKLNEIKEIEQHFETLEREVKIFASELPYWAKYLAEKILSGNSITDNDIENSYLFLLEELELKEKSEKPKISIEYNPTIVGNYKRDLAFTRLENVEGVNALTENQKIEFSPELTVIYGANGSGKSGYVRLLKKVFYTKAEEEILPNIHLENNYKPLNANFTFRSNNRNISFSYSQKNNAEFEQFAVFDNKGLFKQLNEKNEFEFRPAGLRFFTEFTNAINLVEQKLYDEINAKKSGSTVDDLSALFDGESEIKTVVQNLDDKTKIDELKKYTPFSDEDKAIKEKVNKEYDDLLLASKSKEKEIKKFEAIKKQLGENKYSIEELNKLFTSESLDKIKEVINDCTKKDEIVKEEGIERFKTDRIIGVGTDEWKNFIVAAEAFAKKQKTENKIYPENGDNCLFCQQPLSEVEQKLISNYWEFIKSEAEKVAKEAQETLNRYKQEYEKINFNLYPEEYTLTVWLSERYPEELKVLKQKLSEQQILAQNIISDIKNKSANSRTEINVSTEQHETIEKAIDKSIIALKEDEQTKQLEKLQKVKILLEHKEKLNIHFSKFETYVSNQAWIKKAENANFTSLKRKITNTEKTLSDKYFNKKYIEVFNYECQKLKGNFGIDINHTGSAGKSFRQLKLKGKNPSTVLSEGEQNVIALADFLAEMQLSEINRGLIFDDPVNSLDHERKEVIAKRLVELSESKQVIVFTHDIVFVKYLENFSKDKYKDDRSKVVIHTLVSYGQETIGVVELENTPIKDSTYTNSHIPRKYLLKAQQENDREFAQNLIRAGYGALRSCYEGIVVTKLLASTVQRYDTLVRVTNIRNVKFNVDLYERIAKNHSVLHDLIEGHLPVDELNKFLTCDKLEMAITEFETILEEINKI